MLHSRDHLTRPGSRCNHNNRCIYGFPYKVQPTTTINDFGRVQWRRRSEEDAWVVPHCPTLLRFADCHFHFDVVFTTKVFSYLYKYLFKGPDITYFAIDNAHDDNQEPTPINEIADYQKGRYLSAPESAWCILRFEITRREPTVQCLPVHLPGENRPQFRRQTGQSDVSLLQRYFLRSPLLLHLRYEEYYEQFILYPYVEEENLREHEFLETMHPSAPRKKARRRMQHDIVACIASKPLRSGECFYVRALLQHRPAISFRDLRTIDGTTFPSFHEAACDLGLFHNNNEG